jgi:hypothetical protein
MSRGADVVECVAQVICKDVAVGVIFTIALSMFDFISAHKCILRPWKKSEEKEIVIQVDFLRGCLYDIGLVVVRKHANRAEVCIYGTSNIAKSKFTLGESAAVFVALRMAISFSTQSMHLRKTKRSEKIKYLLASLW